MLSKKRTWLLLLLLCLAGFLYVTFTHERFGAAPAGERLKRMEQMATFKEGVFFNTMPEPTNLVKENFFVRMYNIHFNKEGQRTPSKPLPSVKTDLKALAANNPQENVLIPLGHSSYYMQLHGVHMLIDPVFSPYAGPFSFLNKAFEGTTVYTVEDMPPIDYILISHDHYDHLDYDVMKAMVGKVKKVIAPLGVGAHLELWGYAPEDIWEGYWYDSVDLGNDIQVHVLPARHYSSRLFAKNQTLWAGFAFVTPQRKIFYSGDTGYGDHFPEMAQKLGPFDLAILDVGQFNPDGWPHIHLLPEHAAKAATELGAKRLLPAHNSKFAIALHDWKDPLNMIEEFSKDKGYVLLTPTIGQIIRLDDDTQKFDAWWKKLP